MLTEFMLSRAGIGPLAYPSTATSRARCHARAGRGSGRLALRLARRKADCPRRIAAQAPVLQSHACSGALRRAAPHGDDATDQTSDHQHRHRNGDTNRRHRDEGQRRNGRQHQHDERRDERRPTESSRAREVARLRMATMPPLRPPINSIAMGTAIPTGDAAMRASAEMIASTSMMSVATNVVADGLPSTFGRR